MVDFVLCAPGYEPAHFCSPFLVPSLPSRHSFLTQPFSALYSRYSPVQLGPVQQVICSIKSTMVSALWTAASENDIENLRNLLQDASVADVEITGECLST